jgi:hypothetical protein
MLPHLSRSKILRLLAGTACLAVSGAAGALLAQPRPTEPIPPAAPAPVPPAAAPLATTPIATPVPKKVAISELTLARSVLAALDADPGLKDLNLIVSVVDRGAVVGGPVATEDLKKRIEAVIRGVRGVESVKNLCFVCADPDPLMRAMAQRLKSDAKSSSTVPLSGVALAPTAPEGALPPIPSEAPSDVVVSPRPNTVEALHPQLPPVSVLGAPVAVAGPKQVGKVSPLPTIAPTPPPPALPTTPGALTGATPAADLETAARKVLRSDPRFARLTVELKPDGALFVSGTSASPAALRDLRTELLKLPGAVEIAFDAALLR